MQRREFIREIKENLAGKMTEKEIQEIVYDYEEYFDAGIREGKTEEEICSELGSPARITRTILEEGHNGGDLCQNHRNKVEPAWNYAPLGARLIAFFIDAMIAGIPLILLCQAANLVLLMPFMLLPLASLTMAVPDQLRPPIAIAVFSLAFYILYQPVCLLLLNGRTVGKLLMGIKVVHQDGSRLKFTDAIAREIVGKSIISNITLGLAPAVSFIWAVLSKEHKTVHDTIGDTRVVTAASARMPGK